MNRQKTQISTAQLVCLMLVCSVTLVISSNSAFLGGDHILDNLLSCGLAFLCNLVFFVPVFLLMRRRPDSSLLLQAESAGRWLLWATAVFCALYFLLLDIQFLSTFLFFLNNAFQPAVPAWIFPAMIVLASVYASFKGLEALGRTAIVILFVVLLGFLLIGVLLLSDVQPANLTPLLYDGPGQMLRGTAFFLTASGSIVTYLMLFPVASGKKKLGFFLWNAITFSVCAFLIFLLAGVLGNYANLQLFPLYSAATMANLGTFQRLDTVFIGIWLVGIFVKLAINFHVISLCCGTVLGQRSIAFAKPACGAAVLAGSLLLAARRDWMDWLLNPVFTLPATLFAVLALPLLIFFGNCIKDRRRKRHG